MSKAPLIFLAALSFLIFFPAASQASCEICKSYGNLGGNSNCFPAMNEIGVTQCQLHSDPSGWPSIWCTEAGYFCSTIVVNGGGGGGGGGGTGGGGGSCQGGASGCPAECFSCSGGGRPRI